MSSEFNVKYTNKDIMDKLDAIEDKLTTKADLWLVYGSYSFTFVAIIIYIILI